LRTLFRRAAREHRRVEIIWVKGHKQNPYNKAADKAAKRSARNALNAPKSVVSVRRKISKQKTALGSIEMRGQEFAIRVVTAQYLASPHQLWRYKYEVISADSEYFGNVDEIFSKHYLRDGHHYQVRVNESTMNPRIVEVISEIERG
jgi:hypothetical protein